MEKLRILIVEDEAILALNVQKLLSRLGYDVCGIASTGDDAVAMSGQFKPDLIIMDIHLRGKTDGIQAAERIRAFLDIPIVYTTAFADDETLQRAKITEPSGYLLKPYEIRDLQVAIETCAYKHKTDLAVRKREKWVSTVLNNIEDAVLAEDASSRVTYMNGCAERLTGWSCEEALGKKSGEVIRLFSEKSRRMIILPAERTETFDMDESYVLADRKGKEIHVEFSVAPLKEEGGTESGHVVVFRDVSFRKKAEEEKRMVEAQLVQTQKMEAVGKFAGGMAHDFNNFLSIIQGFVDLQIRENTLKGISVKNLQHIQDIVDKANGLTQNLMLFSRKKPMKTEKVEVNRSIQSLMVLIQCILSTRIKIRLELHPQDLHVLADPLRLEQVLMNLTINARDAMPSGGELKIRTEAVMLREKDLKPHPEIRPGLFVCVTVSDTGVGMDAHTLENAIQPFFTTKQEGTGFGLAVVYGIVKEHHGFVRISSERGKGTSFQCYFPAFFAETAVETEEAVLSEYAAGRVGNAEFWSN